MPDPLSNQDLQTLDGPRPARPSGAEEDRRISLIQHLEELRRRLFVVLGAVVVGAGVGLAYSPHVIRWLKAPAGDLLPHLAFLNPAEGFMAHVKVATTIGITLAMPVVLYEIWAFIRPGLSPRERRYGLWFIVWGSALFIIGIIVAYVRLRR